ncbi:MAG: ABC transporter permease, partial [Chitinophagales bacterium]
QKKWDAFKVEAPLSYSFLNERYMDTYLTEQKTGKLLGIFAGFTIVIACLGLFGLAMFLAEQRTKEIGIRKVLGATVPNMTALLSRNFIWLVIIANLVAWPLGWWTMNKWLQDFAYRTPIHWWIFAAAGIFALVIAAGTVSFQAIKAALANPITSLRSE